ncbi:MAG: type II toxin-antitoxin system VapC family toxin [Candidatus Thermoplasmatota archaeon]|nr:type II toxin-antitoxin system VapC family toxin [Candidatus Thermoplasmatota archaeon]MCL5786385.1 type II toxin-antitoxin system VapC family toxin [Candidatus Thermoplasmatota archaeon]
MTWDEVSYVSGRVLGKTDAIEIGKKLMNFPNLRFISVDEEIMRRSQTIRERYNLKPRDSIHLSCALTRNIEKIISDDKDFDNQKEIERVPIKRPSS